MRSLSPDEAALWERVASTIRPLSRDKNDPERVAVQPEGETNAKTTGRPSPAVSARPQRPAGPGTTLDGGWDRRLRSGSLDPDRILDLHGKSLDGAWRAIDHSLEQAIAREERVMLLITGHQRAGGPEVRRGAIRAAIHDWLAASRHAGQIAAVRPAHRRHGGGGSLYIILRRQGRFR